MDYNKFQVLPITTKGWANFCEMGARSRRRVRERKKGVIM
jgi:hypothetical protein